MAKPSTPIPHKISFGQSGLIFVEFFRRGDAACVTGTGYLRTFEDWVRAACYVSELKAGSLSGAY